MKWAEKLSKKCFAGWLIVFLVLTFAGHAFSSGTPKFAYVVNFASRNIWAYNINSTTGALTPVSGSPFPAGLDPTGVAVDPSGRFAYVTDAVSNAILAFIIDSATGALTEVSGSPFAAGAGPAGVAIDPSGKFVYVANRSSDNISAYNINSTTGALTPVSGSPFPAGDSPRRVAVDPSGKFVYVTNFLSDGISAFTIDSTTGALSPVVGSPFGAGGPFPQGIALDPLGKFAYVTFGAFAPLPTFLNVSAYTINSTTGALSPVNGSPFATGTGAHDVAVDPSGKFAYVTHLFSNTVSAHIINSSTGALSSVSGSPFAVESSPGPVLVDPSGNFVYVVADSVSAYAINSATGALTEVNGSPFATGDGASGIAIASQSTVAIALDVRPSSAENPINPKSNGVIPVAILNTDSFDASTVDQDSLRFGPNQALVEGRGQLEDVNGDGLPDLVLHFRTQDSGIQCGDTSVSIIGQTLDGIPIQGSDSITTVGCQSVL